MELQRCVSCSNSALLLRLGGVHRDHGGMCSTCWGFHISISNMCACGEELTEQEKVQVHDFIRQAIPLSQLPTQPQGYVYGQAFGYQPMSPQYAPTESMYPPQYHHSNSSPADFSHYVAYTQGPQNYQYSGSQSWFETSQPTLQTSGQPVPATSAQQTLPKSAVAPSGVCFGCRKSTGEVKLGCGHFACMEDLKKYLTAETKKAKDVKCPNEGCTHVCPAYFIMTIIDKENFAEYRRTYLKSIIVVCPTCTVIEQIGEKHCKVSCSNCSTKYCSRCEKKESDCRCEVPAEVVCQGCYMIMKPDRHRLMVCGNCKVTQCTYCEKDQSGCTCNYNALTAITKIDDVAECQVCGDYMSVNHLENVFTIEECGHVFHKECIEGHASAFLKSGRAGGQLPCPQSGCRGNAGDFHTLVSCELWDLYERKLIEKSFTILQCPKLFCQMEFTFAGNEKIVQCPGCQQNFCLKCKNEPHEGKCSSDPIQNKILMIEATGEVAAQCPGCRLPYSKNESCDHVKCLNPACGVEFCFSCSCLRKPTMEHCNAWHRPECRFYESAGADTEVKRPNCPECTRLGRRCDPPKRLKVKCRFEEGEV